MNEKFRGFVDGKVKPFVYSKVQPFVDGKVQAFLNRTMGPVSDAPTGDVATGETPAIVHDQTVPWAANSPLDTLFPAHGAGHDPEARARVARAIRDGVLPHVTVQATMNGDMDMLDLRADKFKPLVETIHDALTDFMTHGMASSFRGHYPILMFTGKQCHDCLLNRLAGHDHNGHVEFKDIVSDHDPNGHVEFMDIVDAYMKQETVVRTKRMAEGSIVFDDLMFLFTEGDAVTWKHNGHQVGGTFSEVRMRTMRDGKRIITMNMDVMQTVSGAPRPSSLDLTIPDWTGRMAIDGLSVRLITDTDKAVLAARGERIIELTSSPHHMHHHGNMTLSSWGGNQMVRADGRCMVDAGCFRHMDPDGLRKYIGEWDISLSDVDSDATAPGDVDTWRVLPLLLGFSFQAKEWGPFNPDQLTDITWDDRLFSRLVMNQDRKDILLKLVRNHGKSGSRAFSDIVVGKGGGMMLLLSGNPGTGKTLLAESLAEQLRRPLYVITVGELGTTAEAVEECLRNILEMMRVWGAVMLLDEADVFIEARSSRDLARSAIVGVFLRALEYHMGVVLLTTNRYANLDKAVLSRMSLHFHFPASNEGKRAQIWLGLLTAAGYTGKDVHAMSTKLGMLDLNGRDTKNIISLASNLADADGEPLTARHLDSIIALRESGVTGMGIEDAEAVTGVHATATMAVGAGRKLRVPSATVVVGASGREVTAAKREATAAKDEGDVKSTTNGHAKPKRLPVRRAQASPS